MQPLSDNLKQTTGNLYFYHPDHLGTGTFLTDANGLPYEFFLNLPFGETMVEQHSLTEDYENLWKFTGHELDKETGMYYAGARYYNPKWSIWLSVDPLFAKYPTLSPYIYTAQNPMIYIDPNGMEIEYHEDNSFWFNLGTKLRIFAQSIFGSKETRDLIKELKSDDNIHTIKQEKGSYLGSNVQARSLYDYEEAFLDNPIEMPEFDAPQEEWDRHQKEMEDYINNRPNLHRDGTGDGSYITIDHKRSKEIYKNNEHLEGKYKRTKTTTIFHELDHAGRVNRGNIKSTTEAEEIKATQFTNRNFRNDRNRRKKYYKWDVPKEN